MFQLLINSVLTRFKSTTTDVGGGTLEHTPHKIVDNLGVLSASLADDAAAIAIARTQVAAALQVFDPTLNAGAGGFLRARGTIAQGILADVSRIVAALPAGGNVIGGVTLPAAVQTALDAIRDRLPGALVGGRLDVNVGASAALDTIVTRLTEIRDAAIVTQSITLAIPSADTALHAFANQAVKTPVHLSIRKGTAPVTISDGSGTDSILEWDDTTGHHTHYKTFYVANLNQLSYQFSAHNGTQVIEVQAGN